METPSYQWPQPSTVITSVDLQYGSTGKGLLASYLARTQNATACVTAWAPNSGHTSYAPDGTKMVHTMLANGVTAATVEEVFISAGSLVNPFNLKAEIESAKMTLGRTFKVYMHEAATIVTQKHRDQEAATMAGIGSTMKGTGAALMDKIARKDISCIARGNEELLAWCGVDAILTAHQWLPRIAQHNVVLLEGAQGFSLGVNQGFYPFTTSRQCTIDQLCSDTGVPSQWVTQRWGTARTYPIRVANRFNPDGDQIGWSGGCYDDQHEVSWDEVGVEPEKTTVTNLERRVFTFSDMQLQDAIYANGIDHLFMNFMNYLPENEIVEFGSHILRTTDMNETLWGMGARESDIKTELHHHDVPF